MYVVCHFSLGTPETLRKATAPSVVECCYNYLGDYSIFF